MTLWAAKLSGALIAHRGHAEPPPDIRLRLREQRRAANLTQAMVAERAEISREYVSRIERRCVMPSPEILDRINRAIEGLPIVRKKGARHA